VLATLLFIAFWVLLAFALFFVAARGGVVGAREALQTQSRGGRKAIGVIFAILYVGFGIALPVVFLSGNSANASKQISGIKLTSAEKHGRELFSTNCGQCHTLSAAAAIGKVGPNLDMLKPPYSLVLNTVKNGCLQNPATGNNAQSCLGQGVMPAQILQGRDAENVSRFVAKVAGKS
jgi:mono/diheme cytochrome c family protein